MNLLINSCLRYLLCIITYSAQGSPISPLSNIMLHELDTEMERQGLRFVRYADDCSQFLLILKVFTSSLRSVLIFTAKPEAKQGRNATKFTSFYGIN